MHAELTVSELDRERGNRPSCIEGTARARREGAARKLPLRVQYSFGSGFLASRLHRRTHRGTVSGLRGQFFSPTGRSGGWHFAPVRTPLANFGLP